MSRRVAEGIYPDARIVGSLATVGQSVYVEVQQYPFAFRAIVSNPISQTTRLTVTVDGNGQARVFGDGVTQSLTRTTEFRKTRFIPPTVGDIVRAVLLVEVVRWRIQERGQIPPLNRRPQWQRTLYVFDQDGNRTTLLGSDWIDTALLIGIGTGIDPDDHFTYLLNGFHWVPGRGILSPNVTPETLSLLLDGEGWYFDRGIFNPTANNLILMGEPTPWGGRYQEIYSYPPETYSVIGGEVTKRAVGVEGYLGMGRFYELPFAELPNVIKSGATSFESIFQGKSPVYVNINPKTQSFFPIVPLTYSPIPNQAAGTTGRFADLAELSAALIAGLITDVPVLTLPEVLEQTGKPEPLGFGYSGDDLFAYNTLRFNRGSWNFVELAVRQAQFAPIDLSFIALGDSQDRVFAATVGYVDYL